MSALLRYDYVVQRLLQLMPWSAAQTFKSTMFKNPPAPGSLVLLTSAPMTEWHLSFYIERINDDTHLLESLKTGKLANWGNVGFYEVECKESAIDRKMRWTDAQFDFEAKFGKVFKRGDFYLDIPFLSGFDGDNAVIKVRTRHGIHEAVTDTPPFPYLRCTQKALLAHLIAGAEAHRSARDAARVTHAAEGATDA